MKISKLTIYCILGLSICLSTNVVIGNNLPIQQTYSALKISTAIYEGDLILRTQADIDALNNYKSINGNLIIGDNDWDTPAAEIYNLQALKTIEHISGNIEIKHTQLTTLDGLSRLKQIGRSLVILTNDHLVALSGLENLNTIGQALTLGNNPSLENINALGQLKNLRNIVFFDIGITSLKVFHNLEDNQSLDFLQIQNCDKLTSLDGLEKITSLSGDSDSNLDILLNDALTDISALSNIKYIGDDVQIIFNPKLESCCSINKLIDTNIENGHAVKGIFTLKNAPACSTSETILEQDCPTEKNLITHSAKTINFTVYPNPAINEVSINLEPLRGMPVNLILHNQLGQQVWQKKLDEVINNNESISLSGIPNGLYLLQIDSKTNGTITKKLVIGTSNN